MIFSWENQNLKLESPQFLGCHDLRRPQTSLSTKFNHTNNTEAFSICVPNSHPLAPICIVTHFILAVILVCSAACSICHHKCVHQKQLS
jgi:hypothetical protein